MSGIGRTGLSAGRWHALAVALFGLSALALSSAAEESTGPRQIFGLQEIRPSERIAGSDVGSVAINVDNDLLTGRGRDQDYTGGFSVSWPESTLNGPRSLQRVRRWLDLRFRMHDRADRAFDDERHVVQLGLLAFTPQDLTSAHASGDDRPYSSLIFLNDSTYAIGSLGRTMYQTSLSVGLLGTGVAKSVQKVIHRAVGSDQPQGYSQQVSHGGELTAQYAVARHSLLSAGSIRGTQYDIKLLLEGSFGYLTEGSVGIGIRLGHVESPWWTSVSEYANYAPRSGIDSRAPGLSDRHDRYVFTGVVLRGRLYNSFLQGQFRESAVELSSAALRPLLAEVWAGVTMRLSGYRVSYVLRHQTAELRRGIGARGYTWAGITVSSVPR